MGMGFCAALFILFFPPVFSGESKILETDTFASIVEEASSGTLIVCDLDNTVIAPIQIDLPFEDENADMRPIVWMRPVEKLIPEWIGRIQAQPGVYIVALTARVKSLAWVTLHYLRKNEIDFSASTPFANGFAWNAGLKARVLVRDGVIFAGPRNDKGAVLAMLLRRVSDDKRAMPSWLRRVVFIDNTLSRVQEVAEAFRPLDVDFLGYRDTAFSGFFKYGFAGQ